MSIQPQGSSVIQKIRHQIFFRQRVRETPVSSHFLRLVKSKNCQHWAMSNLLYDVSEFGPTRSIESDCFRWPYLKGYKKGHAHTFVLHSLNTSMVLPVEPEFEQVLLYLIHPLPILTWRFPPCRLLKSWKLVWGFSCKLTRVTRRLLILYRFQSESCSSVSYGKMMKVSLRSIAGIVFR